MLQINFTKTLRLGLIFILMCSFECSTYLYAQPVSFPGAEGYGRIATGGRGTLPDGRKIFLDAQVVEVTNLDDYGDGEEPIVGSFRWALDQVDTLYSGNKLFKPTTIVFRVGGVIQLKRDIHTTKKHLTIAGQTAPGDGICFRGATLNLSGSENVIVRHIRSRPGDELGLETSAFRIENGKNFIIDHCSFSLSIEETMHTSHNLNTTVQWCIISESLYNSFHKKGERGYGTQWGGAYASYHHNLMAHHNSRTPRINGSNDIDVEALVDYRNNVNYNWGHRGSFYGGEWMKTAGKGFAHTNVVNNYFVPGPALTDNLTFARPGLGDNGYSKWYFDGNVMVGSESLTNNNWLGVDVSNVGNMSNIRSDIEFVKTDGLIEQYNNYTQTAQEAYKSILEDVGATVPKRDAHDIRLIKEVTGEIPVVRYQYADASGQSTPIKGVKSGLIDTPFNLVSPDDRAAGKDYWSVYSPSGDIAPVDTDHDGMPDEWEKSHELNPNDYTDFRIITPSGYTYLEVYLAELVGDIIDFNTPIETSVVKLSNKNKLFIYPNPVKDQINIQSNEIIVSLIINDLSGRQVLALNGKNLEQNINVGNLSEGYYLLVAKTDKGDVFVSKMIKQ